MGFEVVYKIAKKKDGKYDLENLEELKREIGNAYEDVSLEDLAKAIIGQLSRRDVLVQDVEIYEFTRKKVSFREADSGIVIKNKKFLLDSGVNIVVQDIEEAPKALPVVASNLPAKYKEEEKLPNSRPIKWVTLDPDIPNLHKVKNSGLSFTPDKRYPVYSEIPHPNKIGISIYKIVDDNKRMVDVMDEYFLPADQFLQRGFNSSVDSEGNGPQLRFDGLINEKIPDLRKR